MERGWGASGPLADAVEPFREWLTASGFSPFTVDGRTWGLRRFSTWMTKKGIGANDLDTAVFDEFTCDEEQRLGRKSIWVRYDTKLLKCFFLPANAPRGSVPAPHRRGGRPARAMVGPLAPVVVDRLAPWMMEQGYAPGTITLTVNTAARLSNWMHQHGLHLEALTCTVVESFVANEVNHRGRAGWAVAQAGAMKRFLAENGYLLVSPVQAPTVAEAELDSWVMWQTETTGVSDRTVTGRREWMRGLVTSLVQDNKIDWSTVGVNTVNRYVAEQGRGYAPGTRPRIVAAARSLLRWAVVTGRVEHDLLPGVLSARHCRASIPKGLTPNQVEVLTAAPDPATTVGLRDRAIITLLARLGFRAGEVAALTLDDIDWVAGHITVVGKNRRLTVPLPDDVGHSLVAWLKVRPTHALDRALFIAKVAPARGLSSGAISQIVTRAARKAGLVNVSAHRLRHTAAMDVIAAGGSLVEARELLGHTSSDSTMIYARADLASLRVLAVPFGQVPR